MTTPADPETSTSTQPAPKPPSKPLVIHSRGATSTQAIQAFTAGFDQLAAAQD
jgi:hypothetical protein